MPKFIQIFSILFFNIIHLTAQSGFTSSNLPIVVIDTDGQTIPDTPRIDAKLGIIWNGENQRNYVTDTFNNYNGDITIEVRGATSQSFPKKQYAFETVDSLGENNNVSLLGLPTENDWILHAPYSDKSLMRNVLEYKLARDLGWYASRTIYCELILNDEYRGIYILMEKIKRDKNRVDIAKLKTDDITGDELTGGYIIKIDKNEGDDNGGWDSDYPKNSALSDKLFFQYHYPKNSDITIEQKTYIRNFLKEFEAAMESVAYSDSLNGYEKFIDIPSFVDFLILNEICNNVDGYRLSTFMHKDKDSNGGKLKMGPVWDFNLAFGNANYNDAELIEGWRLLKPYRDIPFWWKKFVYDERFISKLMERWFTLRENELSDNRVLSIIDSITTRVDEAQKRNFEKWDILGEYIWPNFFIGYTYNEEVEYLKSWIVDRLAWMDNNINFSFSGEIIDDQGEYALSFDGDNDFVDCGYNSSLAIEGNEITLEAWIKVNEFRERSYQGAVISRDQMASGADFGYVLRCGGNGYVDFIFGNGNWIEIQSPEDAISKSTWAHVAATYNGNHMLLYVNGELVSQKSVETSIKASATNMFIGNSPAALNRGFDGLIDEVRVWNIARTEQQISSTMNITLGGEYYSASDSGLVGYWRFNEGSRGTTKDRVNNNTGILGAISNDDSSEPAWVETDLILNVDDSKQSVQNFYLKQNYPNPFNSSTTINYNLPKTSKVQITIYNLLGQKVAELVNQRKPAGEHKTTWDAQNLPSGLYVTALKTNSVTIRRKMLLIK